jgi:hypothetical protein
VSTPSSKNGDESPAPEAAVDLRDRWWFRIAAVVVVLLFALLVARGCGSQGRNISDDEAVALARKHVTFSPDRHQVRFVQQGVPPHPFWAVSFYDVGPQGHATQYEVFLVDATTGKVSIQGARTF